MKNLFQKNVKVIAATALAAVVTISMSFKAQETVSVQSQETADMAKVQAKEIKKAVPPAAVAALGVAALACKFVLGYSNANNEIAKNNPINAEIAKVSQFD
ncbi:hypothetical protein D1631_12060 [Chryseobacterium nematophagum]|uniref:Uncharacterized protein n=1 Tax=Chryseobacterium nematophagum TaxID=2305228 RepID=A0A3M7THP2_9FLAO|nr:hypothetical protein [Chryseobacterium nematophagum]RNA62614.1 hypothetical protein D1631_12060 [Chryseobacterium nematophagum]